MMFRRIGSLAVIGVALLTQPIAGQAGSYDIPLTNDDGIESPGLQTLAAELERIGRVHVVAPCGQQSGSSMSVALRNRLVLGGFSTTRGCRTRRQARVSAARGVRGAVVKRRG